VSDPLRFTYESTPGAWRCYYDPEGPQGFGKTKDEALFDLWLSCGEEEPLMKAIVAALAPLPQDSAPKPPHAENCGQWPHCPCVKHGPCTERHAALDELARVDQELELAGVPLVQGGAPTPRTDEVLRIEDNFGAYRDGSGDGVTPQEAHDEMVAALTRLARALEREARGWNDNFQRKCADWDREHIEKVAAQSELAALRAQSGGGVAENVAENAYHDATDKIEEAIRDGADLPRSLLDSLDILIAAYKRSREGGSVQGATSMTRSDRKVLRSAALQLIEEARISRESQTDDAGAWGDKARDAALAMNARIDTLEIALRHIARYEDEDCAISSDDMAKLARAALAAGTAQEQKP
jgi:hypothetical protein